MVKISVLNICVYLAVIGCCCLWVSIIVTVCVLHSFFKLGLGLVNVKAVGRPSGLVKYSFLCHGHQIIDYCYRNRSVIAA